MTGRILLAINCPVDPLYDHRHRLRAMYGERFADMAFLVSDRCEFDPAFRNVPIRWTPGPPGPLRVCDCAQGDPGWPEPHAFDEHHRHPRYAAVAPLAGDFEAVLFIDTDVILAPSLTPRSLLERLGGGRYRALLPPIVAPGPDEWVWVDHETGGVSLGRMAGYLDGRRVMRHWRTYQGAPASGSPEGLPVLSAWSDFLLIESRLLRRIARDFVAFQAVFHEIAVPTVLLHATPRVGVARGAVWWGVDRQQPLDRLLGALREPGVEFCHPVKFGEHGDELVERYRALCTSRS